MFRCTDTLKCDIEITLYEVLFVETYCILKRSHIVTLLGSVFFPP